MDRAQKYAFVVGQLEGEGFPHGEKTLKKALRLNPTTLSERAMQCRDDKELQKLGKETIDLQESFFEGYFKGKGRAPLPPHEKKTLERRIRLIRSGVGAKKDREHQETELKAYLAHLLEKGFKLDNEIVEKLRKLDNEV